MDGSFLYFLTEIKCDCFCYIESKILLSFPEIAFRVSILRNSVMNCFMRLFSCCCRWIAATKGVWQTLQLSRLPNYKLQNRRRTKVAFAYWYIGTGKCWRGKRFSFFRRGLYCNLPLCAAALISLCTFTTSDAVSVVLLQVSPKQVLLKTLRLFAKKKYFKGANFNYV